MVRPGGLEMTRRMLELLKMRSDDQLIEPKRMIEDEGLFGVARIVFNLIRKPDIRRRVLNMRAMFKTHNEHLRGLTMVAYKPTEAQNQA